MNNKKQIGLLFDQEEYGELHTALTALYPMFCTKMAKGISIRRLAVYLLREAACGRVVAAGALTQAPAPGQAKVTARPVQSDVANEEEEEEDCGMSREEIEAIYGEVVWSD